MIVNSRNQLLTPTHDDKLSLSLFTTPSNNAKDPIAEHSTVRHHGRANYSVQLSVKTANESSNSKYKDLTPITTSSLTSFNSYPNTPISPTIITSNDFSDKNYYQHTIKLCAFLLNLMFPTASFSSQNATVNKLELYIIQVMKRSKSDLNLLLITMRYLIQIYQVIAKCDPKNPVSFPDLINCPRRTFLSCLILSWKYQMDENYTFMTWSRITGLPIMEFGMNESKILKVLNFNLYVSRSCHDRTNGLISQGVSMLLSHSHSSFENENKSLKALTPPSSPRLGESPQDSQLTNGFCSSSNLATVSHKHSLQFPATLDNSFTSTNSFFEDLNNVELQKRLARLFNEYFKEAVAKNEFKPNSNVVENTTAPLVHATNSERLKRRVSDDMNGLETKKLKV